jgi:hypothetical protein
VCRGARFAEGPVLASLAMLARKITLRVAPGGSAPLFLSAARRALGRRKVGTGKQVRRSNRKAGLGRDPIDNATRRREHPDEAMPDPLGNIPG